MKMKHGLAILITLLLAPFVGIAQALAPKGCDALNVQGSHDGTITRTAEGVIDAHLLLTNGTTPGVQVKICTAALRPLGTAYDDAANGKPVAVELLTNGDTKLVIASKAIAAGVRVFATASGKVTDAVVSGAFLVGETLTAAAGDGSELEIMPLSPVVNP
jgi:hypothetical protein